MCTICVIASITLTRDGDWTHVKFALLLMSGISEEGQLDVHAADSGNGSNELLVQGGTLLFLGASGGNISFAGHIVYVLELEAGGRLCCGLLYRDHAWQ